MKNEIWKPGTLVYHISDAVCIVTKEPGDPWLTKMETSRLSLTLNDVLEVVTITDAVMFWHPSKQVYIFYSWIPNDSFSTERKEL